MKTKGIIVISTLAVTLCLGLLGASFWLENKLSGLIAVQLASQPHGLTVNYETLKVSLLRRQLVVSKIRAKAALSSLETVVLSADEAKVSLRLSLSPLAVSPAELDFSNLVIDGPVSLKAATLSVVAPAYKKSTSGPFDPEAVAFEGMQASGVTVALRGWNITAERLKAGQLVDGLLSQLSGSGGSLDLSGSLLEAQSFALTHVRLPLLLTQTGNQISDLVSWSAALGQAKVGTLKLSSAGVPQLQAGEIVYQGVQTQGTGVHPLSLSTKDAVLLAHGATLPALQLLAQFGYEQLPFSLILNAEVDNDKDSLQLHALQIDAPGAINFKLLADVRNVSKAWQSGTAHSVLSALMQARLSQAKLIVQDLGLLQRYVQKQADILQVDPDVYVEMRIQGLRPLQGEGGDGEKRVGQVYRAISSFMLSPGELTIEASPTRALGWADLFVGFRGLADFLERLDVTAINRQIPGINPR